MPMSYWPSIIDSQGEKTNPTTTTVMADTGALPTGVYDVTVIFSTEANAQFQVEHRNAANDGNVSDVAIYYAQANASVAPVIIRYATGQRNERFRVMLNQNLTGVAAVTIEAHRVC